MTTPPTITAFHRRVAAIAIACGAGVAALAVSASAGEPATPRRVVVDPQVTTAGGHGCRGCGSGQCRLHGHGGPRHHPECRDGMCVPHCPVRPSTFGFYGTQWRRWPGPGVVPASAEDAVTPMPPPKSAVPGPDEESPVRPDEGGQGLEPQPGADAEDRADARDDVVVPDAEVPAEPMPPRKPQPPIDIVPEPKPAVREEPPAVPDEPPTTEPAAPTTPSAPQRLPSLEDILGGAEPSPGASAEPMPREADGPAAPKAEGLKPEIPTDIFDEDDSPADAPANDGRDESAPPDGDADNPFEDDSASTSDRGVELAGFRYPTAVGGSLEPGGRPWQLAPQKQKRQRAAGSPRGR